MAGLYIHIPFCYSKCAYCDFYSRRVDSQFEKIFCEGLHKEWIMRKSEVTDIQTIYIGGGTPSSLNIENVEKFAEWLPALSPKNEFTVEFNPEDVIRDKLHVWSQLGANRVSMGVQSFNDQELRIVGRRHNSEQAVLAYHKLRAYFSNISLDLIIGLPGQTIETLSHSLRTILSLHPDHISVYILSFETGTRLWAMRQTGKVKEADDELIEQMYNLVCERLAHAGYIHYEISNYALPGKEAVHNTNYWKGVPYLGLGPAAHSYDGTVRRYNPSDLSRWISVISSGVAACAVEEETEVDKVNNYLMTGLRTVDGVNMDDISPKYLKQLVDNLSHLPAERYMMKGRCVSIPERAWLLSDDTISRLFVE